MRTRQKLDIVASGYGRDGGWFVELADETIAELFDDRFEDMFWDSYTVKPLPSSLNSEMLWSDTFWDNAKIKYRSKAFPDCVVSNVISRWSEVENRLLVRALYIYVELTPLERIQRMLRRIMRS